MKKWVFIGTAALMVVVIGVVILGLSKLGPIIKHAVNTYGPKITKTELRLEDVGVSIFSGEAKLKGFYLGNPQGFSSPQAMTVGSIYVNLDETSVASDPIVIEKIEVLHPEITYEKIGRTDNFKTILNNVRSSTGDGSSSQESSQEGGGKKLVIREFILRHGKVTLSRSMAFDKTIRASLPEIRLTNIGGAGKGVTPAEAMEIIMGVLYKQITSPFVVDALKENLKSSGMGTEALEGVTGGSKTRVGGMTDTLKGLIGK
jgi:hypothetical protein